MSGQLSEPLRGAEELPPSSPPRQPLSRNSSLMQPYLELIRSGAKTVEGRIRVGKWADVIPGDHFRFFSTQDASVSVLCRATSVQSYDSFRGMLEGEGLQACLPGLTSLEEGIEVYRSIPGYAEREGPDGVVGVGLQVVQGD